MDNDTLLKLLLVVVGAVVMVYSVVTRSLLVGLLILVLLVGLYLTVQLIRAIADFGFQLVAAIEHLAEAVEANGGASVPGRGAEMRQGDDADGRESDRSQADERGDYERFE
ncbi:hypothetical protein [Haloarchaeobius sp. HRN-SO-5]|uniref:hypothetical protein n=1 Tax=Haloarchaeobius sp. HRN-SO-5 TaxID=3446118 RepID=UPI003EBF39A0